MSIISERLTLNPSELEIFLIKLEQDFGDGLTLYVNADLSVGGDGSIPQEIREVLSHISNTTGDVQTGACVLLGEKATYGLGCEFILEKYGADAGQEAVVRLKNRIVNESDFQIAWQRVDFYGWCPNCAAEKRQQELSPV